jgi:hypothetical protein
MKRIFIFLSLLVTNLCSWSQASFVRTSLYEEFTGENCGPCLNTNWAVDPILLGSYTLAIPLKWEVPLLTAPSNTWSLYQNDKAEINWRWKSSSGSTVAAGPSTLAYGYPSQNTPTDVATNGINVLPTGRFDGQHQWTFGAASDDPLDVTNAVISAAQTQSTNFWIDMNTSWSPTFTNCVVSVSVTSSTSFTSVGALMLRLCLIERAVYFPAPSGINGEKNFYNVVRKSYPTTVAGSSVTGMGTVLNSTWTAGQVQTFSLSCNIPSYIHDLSQMAFVGFVQDDGNRKVYQAARTAQPMIPNDIKVDSLNFPVYCTGTFAPSFVARNLGPVAVSALTIAPYIDGTAQPTFTYNGSIAGGSSVNIALPTYSASYGSHTFSVSVTGVSGGDINMINNTTKAVFGVSDIFATGVTESFNAFPPQNWYVLNYDFGGGTWIYGSAGGYSTSVGSAKYDFWNNYWDGDSDDLFFPEMNLSGVSNVALSFDVAYAQFTNQNDKLEVKASTDCGATWTIVYSKQGAALATAPAYSVNPFVPSATQWRTEMVSLPTLANQPSVLMKFTATANFGNNLYIDNVNIGQTTSLAKNNMSVVSCEVFPNPTSGMANLSINSPKSEAIGITIVNSMGQLIYSSKNNLDAGINNIQVNTESWPAGVYFVSISTSNGSLNKKLNVVK